MIRLATTLLLALCASATAAPDPLQLDVRTDRLRSQLDDFLSGATVNDAAIHDAFWAEELVYTSSRGTRFGKASLMAGVQESGPVAPEDVDAVYSARDVRIRLIGELALLDFVLVAAEGDGSAALYLNSGVFVWRGGRWQAVSWQATTAAPE
jgi:hypothetical protein